MITLDSPSLSIPSSRKTDSVAWRACPFLYACTGVSAASALRRYVSRSLSFTSKSTSSSPGFVPHQRQVLLFWFSSGSGVTRALRGAAAPFALLVSMEEPFEFFGIKTVYWLLVGVEIVCLAVDAHLFQLPKSFQLFTGFEWIVLIKSIKRSI